MQISSWLGKRPSRSLVVLIDEYDAPLVICLDKEELFRDVRMVMSSFFSTLKSKDDCLRFLFMTGITKFSSTSIFSDFNDLTDISLNPEYGALVGYTESEIERYFDFYINEAAKVLGLPREEILSELKANYNGFSFDSEARIRVYCPWSVLSFFNNPNAGFRNYCFSFIFEYNCKNVFCKTNSCVLLCILCDFIFVCTVSIYTIENSSGFYICDVFCL